MSHRVLCECREQTTQEKAALSNEGRVIRESMSAVRMTLVRQCKETHIEDVIRQVMSREDTWQGYK